MNRGTINDQRSKIDNQQTTINDRQPTKEAPGMVT